jgi:YidC/Oxa1 family membrane protein insertase
MSFENDDQNSNKNLFIAIFLFLIFMVGYNYFFEKKHNDSPITKENVEPKSESKEYTSSEESLKKTSRIYIENSKLKSSIDLCGSVIDSVILKDYKQTTESSSANVDLLSPKGTKNEFFYSISYEGHVNADIMWEKIPDSTNEIHQVVNLKAQTPTGLVVERNITLDDGYMIKISDKLVNTSEKDISVSNSADIIRREPAINNYAVVHEGFVGINAVEDKISEVKYSDVEHNVSVGNSKWFGYTDIYWLISHIGIDKNTNISYSKIGENVYKCSLAKENKITIKPKESTNLQYSVFVGPKDVSILQKYSQNLDLDKFDMAIDFGWFFMLTKPLLHLLDIMARIFNNMGVVILLITLMFKIITYPLMGKSLRSAAKMREVQPKIAALQKAYAHDKQRMNQELVVLYKKEQISPLSGCFPMLLQAPIFFCLYKVFFISIEMRHAPLFGWIRDLSAPDQCYLFNLFGVIDWIPPKFLQIGVWPLIMGLSMFLQQKLSSAKGSNSGVPKTQEAKIQENMMYALPVIFTYICSSFPVGVVVYWTISNVFSIIQQYYLNNKIKRRLKRPI